MSLRVWLPLTKDLRQQGLSAAAATAYGAVAIDNNGKLGKCYKIGTGTGRITVPASIMTSFTECSVAFWININSWQTSWDTVFQAGLGSSPWNSYIFGILRNQGNSLVCAISNTSSSSQGNYMTPNLTLGTWYHLAFTYKSGHVCIYVNGQLHQDYSTSIVPKFSSITYVSFGQLGNATSYQCDCKMNDIRIYDHCLSPMEVKELSKGLVLHYPLNRQGWGQENLLKNTGNLSLWNKEANITATWDATEQMYKVVDSSHTSSRWGIYYDFTVTPNTTYTFTVDGKKADTTAYMGIQTFESSRTWPTNRAALTTTRQRLSYTITSGANDTVGRIYLCLYPTTDNTKTAYFALPKLEIGSVATPWCPHIEDTNNMGLNSTTEYDCSGFCNNGTRIGTFSWTSDTPKYSVSTAFSGSQYITEDNEIETTDSTIAAWVKTSLSANAFILDCRNSSGAGKQPIYQYTNGSIQSGGASQYVTTNTGLLVANTWIHLAIVQSGSSLLVYKNGSLFQTLSCTNSPIIKPTVGARYSLSGLLPSSNLSDLRIYATALSADDVKSLYQNCATIDPDGTIRGQIRS